uniref:Chloride channel protein n=1 Tax=Aegilops tauschii TaxID=37682 RepID=M8BP43_AEGTA
MEEDQSRGLGLAGETPGLKHGNGVSNSSEDPGSAGDGISSLEKPLLKRSNTLTSSHLAMVGAKVSHIESLDYEIIENDLFKHDWRSRSNVEVLQYIFLKWSLAFLVGLLTGVIASLINLAIENISGLKMLHMVHLVREKRYWAGFFYFSGFNFVLTFIAAVLCVVFAPTAAGPGIPEIKAYLNGVDTPNMFGAPQLIVKIIGSICAVSSGLDLGKEGPLVHIGACLANLLSQGGSGRFRLRWKWLGSLHNARHRWAPRRVVRRVRRVPVARGRRAVRAGGGGHLVAERAAVAHLLQHGHRGGGPDGEAGAGAGRVRVHVGGAVRAPLRRAVHAVRPGVRRRVPDSLRIFFAIYCVLGLFTFGIAVPSGLFLPIILMGAAYGRIVALVLQSTVAASIDHGLYAVLGAAALMSGSMRMTVSLCVIFLELTNNLLLLPMTMFVLLIAKTVGDAFNPSIYEIILDLKGLPFLEPKPEPWMKDLTVGELAAAKPRTISLQVVEKVSTVLEVLKNTGHNGFPVVDRPRPGLSELHGLVLRSHLVAVLRKRWFLAEKRRTEEWEARERFSSVELADKNCKIDDLELTPEELEMYIDLHPFTNTTPYTVVETMSVAKAVVLFRSVALRHMLIMPKYQGPEISPLVGILTRQDLRAHNILGAFPHLAKKSKTH